jgi:hypothetical protein
MHNYHDTANCLPFGATNTPRHTFVVSLWPYLDQAALYNAYNFSIGFYLPPNCVTSTTTGLIATKLPIYSCPSDRDGYWQCDIYWRARGDYVVNWGNVTRPQSSTPTARAPFGYNNDNPATPRSSRFRDFTDGLSNTPLMAEILMAKSDNSSR